MIELQYSIFIFISFKKTSYLYMKSENYYNLRPATRWASMLKNGTFVLCFSMIASSVYASELPAAGTLHVSNITQQQIKVKGIVVDGSGSPIIGANVNVDKTSNGTMTDVNGEFTLSVSSNSIIRISYIGYTSQTVLVNNRSNIKVVLVEDSKVLDEIVVTAMGIERKATSLTYSADIVGGKEVTRAKETNLVNSLQGKSAGLVITPNSSGAGGSSSILLRGNKSAKGSNQPLIVIDGIPMANPQTTQQNGEFAGRDGGDAISNLNPDDIASINILKGASAAALYGSMAANGVVLITTKKGKEGDVKAEFSSNITIETPLLLPKLQSTYGANSFGENKFGAMSWGDKINGDAPAANRVKDFFRTGSSFINSVVLSGGTEKSQTYLSYANTTAFGIVPTNDFMRHNITARESFNFFQKRLTVDASMNYITQKGTNRHSGGTYWNPLTGLYAFPANGNLNAYKENFETFDAVRNLNAQSWYTEPSDFTQNPYWILNRNKSTEKRDHVIASGTAKFKFTDYLNIQGRLSLDNTTDYYDRETYATTTAVIAPSSGRYQRETFGAKQFYGDVLLNFNKTINKFDVSASVGSSFLDYNTSKSIIDSDKFGLVIPNFFAPENVNGNPNQKVAIPRKRLNSVFGTMQVGYKNMLFADVTGRNDWSSTLAYTNNKSYFYPSVGLTAVLSEMFTIPNVNLLKLRGSYSVVGNDMPAYITNPLDSYNLGGLDPNTKAPFKEMKPEKMHSMEFGFDLGMLENRLNIDFTYYKTNNKNQYFEIKAPVASGYSTYYINTGNIQNEGVETAISYTQEFNKDLNWKTSFNVSYNDNTVKELDPDLGKSVSIGEGAGFSFRLQEGSSYGDIYTRKLKRDDKGVIQLKDGSPMVNGDYEYVGNVNSKWHLGWGNTINYKDFSFYFLVDGKIGGKTVGMTQSYLDSYGVSQASADARNNGGVDIGNGTKIDAKTYYAAVAGRDKAGAEYVYNATNFRLRELSLGYTFRDLLGASRNLSVSCVARNLFFIYKDAPHDPDMSMSTDNGFKGFDIFGLPATRSLGLNLKLTF